MSKVIKALALAIFVLSASGCVSNVIVNNGTVETPEIQSK